MKRFPNTCILLLAIFLLLGSLPQRLSNAPWH